MSKYNEAFVAKYGSQPDMDYATETMYEFMLNAPKAYRKEKQMIEFMESNPDATLRQVFDYFNEITPDGLSPDDDGEDIIEEAENGN